MVRGHDGCRTLFVHAGILPSLLPGKFRDLDALNAAMSLGLMKASTQGRYLQGTEGPVWTRDYAEGDEGSICSALRKVLSTVGARRMVVGHTVQAAPTPRCQGAVILLDVGMSAAYGGRAAYMECINGEVNAWHKQSLLPGETKSFFRLNRLENKFWPIRRGSDDNDDEEL